MSYAIYGESDAYVHLVSAPSLNQALSLFLEDVSSVGVKLSHVYNVYAVYQNQEDHSLETMVNNLIKEDEQND